MLSGSGDSIRDLLIPDRWRSLNSLKGSRELAIDRRIARWLRSQLTYAHGPRGGEEQGLSLPALVEKSKVSSSFGATPRETNSSPLKLSKNDGFPIGISFS